MPPAIDCFFSVAVSFDLEDKSMKAVHKEQKVDEALDQEIARITDKTRKPKKVDDPLEREIARIREKIAARLGEDQLGLLQPRSASTPPYGFIGFKERSFHEEEV
jgi:uncharacterized protein YlxW (UPF0749 family)